MDFDVRQKRHTSYVIQVLAGGDNEWSTLKGAEDPLVRPKISAIV